jgi:hypothetical protein
MQGAGMTGFDSWVLTVANRYIGKPLGFYFTDSWMITVPVIIIVGLTIGWIYMRPRRSKY